MTSNIHLGDFSTAPLYNIKAVVKATGITPSTLRAWERRYNMCQPQRSESGYRLYSERDLAVIRWLKAQVDAGMTISQAVAWMNSIVEESGGQEQAALPGSGPGVSESTAADLHVEPYSQKAAATVRDYAALEADLLTALLNFQEARADQVISEAFSMYTLEQVGENVVLPVLVEIGERWHRGEISTTIEHFATSYLLQRLAGILHTVPYTENGSPIWVGCAPGEFHEVGAMLLTIYLRRAGYAVHYLGQNLVGDDVVRDAERIQPALVLLSATSEAATAGLVDVTNRLAALTSHPPTIGYGGQLFERHPELRDKLSGVYVGATAKEALDFVDDFLRNGGAQ